MFISCYQIVIDLTSLVVGKARGTGHTFLILWLGFSPPHVRALLGPVQRDAVGKSQKSLSCRVCVVASGTALKKFFEPQLYHL